MPQPTEDHHTAKDLSPEELAECRRWLNLQFQNRKVDEALLHHFYRTGCFRCLSKETGKRLNNPAIK